jgi:hypothetical protein
MWRKQLVAVATALSLLVLTLIIFHQGYTPRDPVYALSQVRAALQHDPGAWVNRTLLVRGLAVAALCAPAPVGPPACPAAPFRLAAVSDAATNDGLLLRLGTGNRLVTALRRLPLLGTLLPEPQVLYGEEAATYRVQIRAAPAGSCLFPPCYEALLLDAAP